MHGNVDTIGFLDTTCVFIVPDFTATADVVQNCYDTLNVCQEPAAGDTIFVVPDTVEIKLIAKNAYGKDSCYMDVIISAENAAFMFMDISYCRGDTNPTAMISGTPGGMFSSMPSGLVFSDSVAGTIDLVASMEG